jgi:hypothetical protein
MCRTWGVMILPRLSAPHVGTVVPQKNKKMQTKESTGTTLQFLYRSHPLPHDVLMHVPVPFLRCHGMPGADSSNRN